jgi:hypothetical protein
MVEDSLHNPPDGGVTMLSLVGRDPSATGRQMSNLWASATARGIVPVRWELGFFNLRDLQQARDPGHGGRSYVRLIESTWGCDISVVSFCDEIALIASDGVRYVLESDQ